MKKINFKQPKYVIPTLVYIGSLVIPYLFMEVFDVEIEDKKDANLQTTEYLNAQLPSANVSKDIGSKRKNMRDAFGEITDRSAVQDFTENQDTVKILSRSILRRSCVCWMHRPRSRQESRTFRT